MVVTHSGTLDKMSSAEAHSTLQGNPHDDQYFHIVHRYDQVYYLRWSTPQDGSGQYEQLQFRDLEVFLEQRWAKRNSHCSSPSSTPELIMFCGQQSEASLVQLR